MNDEGELAPADEEHLNELFGSFVEALSDGREVDLEQHLSDRPDLISAARELLAVAGEVAVRKPVDVPRFKGYEILSEVGRGGMGKVYLARHHELGRTVALKTLPAQWSTGERAIKRFEREARAVARLKHPNIIPIYDVGEQDGCPYFTMEYVKGRTLTGVLEGLRGLGVGSKNLQVTHLGKERTPSKGETYLKGVVRYVLDIARALDHAHGEGVVHRDVKPSNILVRSDGTAMLFDFGLATLEESEVLTMTGEFVGTPHYVSPEQAAGRRASFSTDIFSLGATLYELVTLERPFGGITTRDILQEVQERDPRPPSRLNRDVPRDLETICLTAMAKSPNRRYPSATSFAQDLERFLEGIPVHARSVGTIERTWRLACRRPAATLSICLGALLLFGTPSALYLQGRAANKEISDALLAAEESEAQAIVSLADARRERDIAQEINNVLQNMFASVNPSNSGRDARVFELLDNVSKKLEPLRPEVRAALELDLGTSYMTLTLMEESLKHIDIAYELYSSLPGTPLETMLHVRAMRCMIGVQMGRHAQALECLPGIREEYEAAGLFDENYGHVMNSLGLAWLEADELDKAVDVLRTGLEDSARRSADGKPDATFEHNLALALSDRGEIEEGLRLMRSAWQRRVEKWGPQHAYTIDSLGMLAQMLKEAGELTEARELMERTVESSLVTYGEGHVNTVFAVHNLAGLHLELGDLDEAERLELRALELAEAVLPAEHPINASIFEILAEIVAQLGRGDEAIEVQMQSLVIRQEVFGEDHVLTIQAHFILGRYHLAQGQAQEAREQFELAREHALQVAAVRAPFLLLISGDLVRAHRALGEEEAALAVEASMQETLQATPR